MFLRARARACAYRHTSMVLQEHAKEDLATHITAIELYARKRRFLKCVQAVKRAAPLAAPGDPALHRALVRFLVSLEGNKGSINPAVRQVVELELADSGAWGLPQSLSASPGDYNKEYMAAFGSASLVHASAAAWALAHLAHTASSALPVAQVAGLLERAAVPSGSSLRETLAALAILRDLGLDASLTSAFCAKARVRFPLSPAFAEGKA